MFINPADVTHGQREIHEARYITIEFDKKQKQSIQEPISQVKMAMGPSLGTIISGAFASFIINMMVHAYIEVKALIMVPMDLLVAVAIVPFYPVWIAVIYGLIKVRKWSFKLGLVISVAGVVFSVAGITIGWMEAFMTLAFDFIQIGFCVLGLRAKF
jgi:hypothetical protein